RAAGLMADRLRARNEGKSKCPSQRHIARGLAVLIVFDFRGEGRNSVTLQSATHDRIAFRGIKHQNLAHRVPISLDQNPAGFAETHSVRYDWVFASQFLPFRPKMMDQRFDLGRRKHSEWIG